jgi:hypothetical protein
MINLQEIKDKIIAELRPIMPDIHISIYANDSIVHKVGPVKTIGGGDYYPFGSRAYVGMKEAKIWVRWDKFYDRICGNGWMYGQDALFKFDPIDGDCKYCEEPTYIQQYINEWIAKIKQERQILSLLNK